MSKWRFGGTPFFGNGQPIVTEFPDADELPTPRGDNPTIPLREGRLSVDQLYDQRKISMGLYLDAATISALETNHDTLRTLFGNPRQQLLERIQEDGTIRQAYAKAANLQVKRVSPLAMKMTVDFLMANPFFRSTAKTSDEQVISASPKTYTLTNPGTAPDRSAVITLTGPLTNPKITNILTNPVTGADESIWLSYTGVINSGEIIVISVADFTCLYGATNYLDKISHSGDAYFFALLAGANSLKAESAVATTGKVKIEFYAPYF